MSPVMLGICASGRKSSESGFYGSSIKFDALGNLQVGESYLATVSYRFRAEQSSTLTNFRIYWLNQDYPGYGGGNGGSIRYTIQTDSGGFPSGIVLATLDVANPASDFPLRTFSSPPTLTKGILYHLVLANIDASPAVNFGSIDSIFYYTVDDPRQPNRPDADYAVTQKLGAGAWELQPNYTPIVDFTFGNGAHQGIGYMETEDAALYVGPTTSNMVREIFTVTGANRVVTGAGVRVAKTAGTGTLVVTLENSAGTTIDSFAIAASSIPTMTIPSQWNSGAYVFGTFAAPQTLVSGQTYRLRLSSTSNVWCRGIQKGSANGFDPATYFADGYIQHTVNGTTWNYVTGLDDAGDLQFYFI